MNNLYENIDKISKACYLAFPTEQDQFSFDFEAATAPRKDVNVDWAIGAAEITPSTSGNMAIAEIVTFTLSVKLNPTTSDLKLFIEYKDTLFNILNYYVGVSVTAIDGAFYNAETNRLEVTLTTQMV